MRETSSELTCSIKSHAPSATPLWPGIRRSGSAWSACWSRSLDLPGQSATCNHCHSSIRVDAIFGRRIRSMSFSKRVIGTGICLTSSKSPFNPTATFNARPAPAFCLDFLSQSEGLPFVISEDRSTTMNIIEDSRPLAEFYPELQRRSQVHYAFAHRFLSRYAHDNPMNFVLHDGADPTRFIQARWQMFEDMFGLRSYGDTPGRMLFRRVADLTAWNQAVGGFPAMFIQMPVPEGPACTFFGAVALLVPVEAFQTAVEALEEHLERKTTDLDQRLLAPLRAASCRYFTLERSLALDGSEDVLKLGAFCEWTREGEHRNFGLHLPATREAFADSVDQALRLGSGLSARASFNPQQNTLTITASPQDPGASRDRQ